MESRGQRGRRTYPALYGGDSSYRRVQKILHGWWSAPENCSCCPHLDFSTGSRRDSGTWTRRSHRRPSACSYPLRALLRRRYGATFDASGEHRSAGRRRASDQRPWTRIRASALTRVKVASHWGHWLRTAGTVLNAATAKREACNIQAWDRMRLGRSLVPL